MSIGTAKVATVAESADATGITGNQPPGLADGDVVFAAFANTSNISNFSPPSGWTELVAPRAIGTDQTYAVYYRYFADADTWSAPSASWTTSGRASCIVVAYSGADPTTPIDVTPSVASGTAPLTITGVTTTRYGARLITGAAANTASSNTITAPSGFTQQAMTTGTGRREGWGDKATTTAGASGNQQWTCSGSLSMTGFLTAVRPWWPTVEGVCAGVAELTGSVTATRLATGTCAATTQVSGDATVVTGVPEEAAGTIDVVAALVGVATVLKPVGGAVEAVSATSGAVTIAHYGVSGTSTCVATMSGTIDSYVAGVHGTCPVTSTTSGTIDTLIRGVSGIVGAVATISGAVVMTTLVSGTVTAVSTTAAAPGAIYLGAAGTVACVSATIGAVIVAGKPEQGNKVLELFNPDEVLTGNRVTYFTVDLLTPDEKYLGALTGAEGGELSFDAYASVKGSGRLTVSTDSVNRWYPEGQPDFLGVRIDTPTGVEATATADSLDRDTFICADADAVDISVNDTVMLSDSGGTLKESTLFTVRSKASSLGSTTITFTPSALLSPETTDILRVVTASYENTIDWLNVRLRPSLRIARMGGRDDPLGTEVPLGVFLCAAPPEHWEATGLRREIELVDKLSILDQDIASGSTSQITAYTAAAGANIIDLVTALITETGEACPAIVPSTATVAAARVWDIGTTRLKIINDLLDAAAYFSLWCDGRGQYRAEPYVLPSQRTPVYESIAPFSNGPLSLMDPAWVHDRDIYSIPNRYFLVSQGDGTTAALTATATNVNPDSPFSYPSRGRWITAVEVGVEAVDQAALDALAAGKLSRVSSVTNQIEVSHVFLPDLHMNSVVRFVNPDAELDTYCYVIHTTVPLNSGGLCSTAMRIIS